MVAGQRGSSEAIKNAAVHTSVHIGPPEGSEGFGLAVDIHVEGVEDQALIDAGHAVRVYHFYLLTKRLHYMRTQACPYSRALKDGAVVRVSKGKGDPATGAAGTTKSTETSGSSGSSDSSSSGSSKPDGIEQSGAATGGYQ